MQYHRVDQPYRLQSKGLRAFLHPCVSLLREDSSQGPEDRPPNVGPARKRPTLIGPQRMKEIGLTSLRENSESPRSGRSISRVEKSEPRARPHALTGLADDRNPRDADCLDLQLATNRHPERSAARIYRVTQRLAARSRRTSRMLILALLLRAFQPPKPASRGCATVFPRGPRTRTAASCCVP